MAPWILDAGLVVGSLGGWFGLYGLMLVITRPRRVEAAAASPDLRDEPPAIASLLGNGWELTEDAAEATLLDLGARRILEFRQPANDPYQTTIHIRQPAPTGLTAYEQRVFDRVAHLAVDKLVPLTALTFRDARRARAWFRNLRSEVVADARTRRVSRRRFSPHILAVLSGAALAASAGVLLAAADWARRDPSAIPDDDNPVAFVIGVAVFTFVGLTLFAGRNIGERDTAEGREAAAGWLGLRSWLRGHESFADLPPAAVATWDRYIPYGAALGASRLASTVIDMGMGNRRRLWSSYGGTWHRVRVSYPRFLYRYGRDTWRLALRALIAAGIGYVLVRWWRPAVSELASVWDALGGAAGTVQAAGFVAGIGLLGYGGYVLVRAIADVLAPASLTGQVLWKQIWRKKSGGQDSPAVPWLYYLAIDDGRGDRTRAWGLPAGIQSQCDTGDTVTLRVRRWSRRVVEVSIVESAPRDVVAPATVEVDHEAGVLGAAEGSGIARSVAGALAGTLSGRGTGRSTEALLTAEEVGAALGVPVRIEKLPSVGPTAGFTYRTVDRGRTVLMLQVARGGIATMASRVNARGTPLDDVGDTAWVHRNRAAARSGATAVVLTLLGPGRASRTQLPDLLRQAVDRIPAQAAPTEAAPTEQA